MTLALTDAIMYSKKTTKVLKSNAFKNNGVYCILITYKKDKKGCGTIDIRSEYESSIFFSFSHVDTNPLANFIQEYAYFILQKKNAP